jgi:hypothetical protein
MSLKDVRIKMQLNEAENSVNCFLFNGKDYVYDLSWARILGMKVIFASIIIETIKNSLIRLSNENEIEPKDINARIYAIDESGKPNIYIYNSKKPLKKIELSEIL